MKEEKSFFKLMQKVPGGLIIVPMLIGVLANTFIPNVLEIGGFTSGMFKTGTACLLGMFLLLNGASIDVKKIGMPLYKGCTLTLMKFVVGIILGLLVAKIGGAAGFCGITSMAMIAGITNSAGGLYLGLAQQYGDETECRSNLNLITERRTILYNDRYGNSWYGFYPNRIIYRNTDSSDHWYYLGKSGQNIP